MNSKKLSYDFIRGQENNINLVFVHGTGCNRHFLRALAEQFPEYNCYLIDLPGHGDSKNTGYNSENYVDAVSCFISDMENVILIGHSLGGVIVVGTGEIQIESVKGLVILSSGASFPVVEDEFIQELKNNIVNNERFASFMGHFDNSDIQKAALYMEPDEIKLQDSLISLDINYEKDLEKINVPVCIMVGEKDKLTLPEYSQHLHQKIKNSTLDILPDTMHGLPLARKEKVSEIMKDFIKKL